MLGKSLFSHKLIHVAIVVRDMDKAIKRLTYLGMGPFEPFDPGSLPEITEKSLYKGRPFTPDCKLYTGKMGELDVEIIEPGKGESPWRDFLDDKGGGIHHLAFSVDDLDKEIAELTEQGAKVIISAKWQGGGSAYMDLGFADMVIELEKK